MFNRFDVLEALWVLACDLGLYGVLQRLRDMGFNPRIAIHADGKAALTERQEEIYNGLILRARDTYKYDPKLYRRKPKPEPKPEPTEEEIALEWHGDTAIVRAAIQSFKDWQGCFNNTDFTDSYRGAYATFRDFLEETIDTYEETLGDVQSRLATEGLWWARFMVINWNDMEITMQANGDVYVDGCHDEEGVYWTLVFDNI